MGTTLEAFADWAAHLDPNDIPLRLLEKARWQLASVLAASYAGLLDEGAKKVLAFARSHSEHGQALVVAGGFRAPRPTAVFANAAMSCAFDFDEILLLGHPGHSTALVPLVLGEELGARFGEMLAAQIAGNEIAGRLGLATFFGPQNGQMIPFLHCAGAAVAASRILGLDAHRMAHALAIALSQPPSALWPAFLGSIESKLLVAAQGALMGVHAAELAFEGLKGPLDLLDHPRGFFHRFTYVPVRRALGGLGRAWLTDTLQVKLHAACWYFQPLLDAITQAVAQRGAPPTAAEIKSVTCRVTFLAHAVSSSAGSPPDPLSANDVNFSVPLSSALALLLGQLQPEDLSHEALAARAQDVRAVASRVTVVHDRALTARMLGEMEHAIDLTGLLGDVPRLRLYGALRSARREFTHASSIGTGELLGMLARAPAAAWRLLKTSDAPYDLGAHDLSNLLLPIPGGFEAELADGSKLSGECAVEQGALGLDGAREKVARKLLLASEPALGEERSGLLVDWLAQARADTRLTQLVEPMLGESARPAAAEAPFRRH